MLWRVTLCSTSGLARYNVSEWVRTSCNASVIGARARASAGGGTRARALLGGGMGKADAAPAPGGVDFE